MSRTIPAAILTALGEATVEPFYAVEMDFDAGAVRLWTGNGNRTIDGQTYTGTGNLISIDGLDEAADLSAKSANLSLAGIPSSYVAIALDEPYQGRKCRILFGVKSVSDFVEVFSGLMDVMSIEDSGDTSTISLTVESRLVELERPRALRYTHESQQALNAGDTFFSFVADLQDKDILWGRTKA
jgi:hypothetical protein